MTIIYLYKIVINFQLLRKIAIFFEKQKENQLNNEKPYDIYKYNWNWTNS